MRVSQYSVLAPLANGDYLLYNGVLGTWDAVSRDFHDTIKQKNLAGLTPEQHRYGLARGHFTTLSPDEERAKAIALGQSLRQQNRNEVKFVLMPTMGCNLACPYCFQGGMRDAGQAVPIIHRDQVDAAFRAIDTIQAEQGITNSHVVLFGGEPLMAETMDTVAYIIEQCQRRGLSLGAITNAAELQQFEPFLGPNGLRSVQVTIDGPARIHDSLRYRINGEGTFAEIARNLCLALERGVHVNLRINVGEGNLASLPELIAFFSQQGWLRNPKFRAYTAYIHTPEQTAAEALRCKRKAVKLVLDLNRAYRRRVLTVLDGTPGVRLDALLGGYGWGRTPMFCTANLQHYLLAPDGNIYACWKMVGEEVNRIGRYMPDAIIDQEQSSQWFERSSMVIEQCQNCPHMFSCGGGCSMHALNRNGVLHSSYCDGFDQLIKAELQAYFLNRALPPNPLCPSGGRPLQRLWIRRGQATLTALRSGKEN